MSNIGVVCVALIVVAEHADALFADVIAEDGVADHVEQLHGHKL